MSVILPDINYPKIFNDIRCTPYHMIFIRRSKYCFNLFIPCSEYVRNQILSPATVPIFS